MGTLNPKQKYKVVDAGGQEFLGFVEARETVVSPGKYEVFGRLTKHWSSYRPRASFNALATIVLEGMPDAP